MIALSDITSVIALGIVYGYFSGTCMFTPLLVLFAVTNNPRYRAVRPVGHCDNARLV
jgi:hypothetical protein